MELNPTYIPDYDAEAFRILSEKPLRSLAHVCDFFSISRNTLDEWRSEYETFNNAINIGLMKGEKKARDILTRLSFRNTKNVNTKLLLTMIEDVYDIRANRIQLSGDKENPFQVTRIERVIVKPNG